ncbi:hypothetical protein BKA62DRAFT_690246 [Auriculariales sp. MPI-PUGE-AT-0066]|nr:hypothetical protein BKA62DRAFT_690246 [Auriculariales sp. MPI-PUGE-AT-0066]
MATHDATGFIFTSRTDTANSTPQGASFGTPKFSPFGVRLDTQSDTHDQRGHPFQQSTVFSDPPFKMVAATSSLPTPSDAARFAFPYQGATFPAQLAGPSPASFTEHHTDSAFHLQYRNPHTNNDFFYQPLSTGLSNGISQQIPITPLSQAPNQQFIPPPISHRATFMTDERVVPFQATLGLNTGEYSSHLQSITAMPQYENYSFEELRLEHYARAQETAHMNSAFATQSNRMPVFQVPQQPVAQPPLEHFFAPTKPRPEASGQGNFSITSIPLTPDSPFATRAPWSSTATSSIHVSQPQQPHDDRASSATSTLQPGSQLFTTPFIQPQAPVFALHDSHTLDMKASPVIVDEGTLHPSSANMGKPSDMSFAASEPADPAPTEVTMSPSVAESLMSENQTLANLVKQQQGLISAQIFQIETQTAEIAELRAHLEQHAELVTQLQAQVQSSDAQAKVAEIAELRGHLKRYVESVTQLQAQVQNSDARAKVAELQAREARDTLSEAQAIFDSQREQHAEVERDYQRSQSAHKITAMALEDEIVKRRRREQEDKRREEEQKRKEADEEARRKAEERSRREAEERARQEAEKRAREAKERFRREFEERVRRETEERVKKERQRQEEHERQQRDERERKQRQERERQQQQRDDEARKRQRYHSGGGFGSGRAYQSSGGTGAGFRASTGSTFAHAAPASLSALTRYSTLCVAFDAAKFNPDQKLALDAIPWPVLLPSPVQLDQVTWDAVSEFFSQIEAALNQAAFADLIDKAHKRFHPDRWGSRTGAFKHIAGTDEQRAEVEKRVNAVSQVVTPLWAKRNSR